MTQNVGDFPTITPGAVSLTAGANITLSQVGNTITIVGGAGGTGGGGGVMVAASDTTYTSGTVSLTGVGGGVTVKSNTGQRVDISVAAPVAQTAQTGISSIQASDATYTSGKVIFSGVGAATVNSNTGQRVDISVAAQSVQIVQSAIQGSDATYTSGKVILTGVGGGITVNSNTGQRIDLSVAAPVAQTAQTGISSIQGSDATYTSGKVIFTGVGGGITVSSNTGQRIDLSVAAPVVQTAQTGISSIQASDATYTSGKVIITGTGGGVTVNSNTGQRVDISVAAPVAQTAQTQSNLQAVVPLGNTTGTTGSIQTGTFGLAAGANITISQSSGTASTNLTIVGGVGGGGVNIAASNTTFTSGTVVMSASGGAITINSGAQSVGFSVPQTSSLSASTNITLSVTGSTVQFSVAAQSVQTQNLVDWSVSTTAGGGTAGTMALASSGTVTLYAGNNITISQSATNKLVISGPNTLVSSSLAASTNITLSVNGSTIQFSVANPPKLHAWQNMPVGDAAPMTYLTAISKTPFYWPETLPGGVTLNSIGFLASIITTGTLQSFTVHFGVYTYVNSTSAALLGSAAESFILSTGTSASFSGQRMFVLTSPGTVAAISNLTPGAYIFGSMVSAGASQSMNLSLFGGAQQTGTIPGPLGIVMPGTNNPSTATSQGVLMYGRGSTTVNAMPANVSRADLINQGAGVSVPLHPYMLIRS